MTGKIRIDPKFFDLVIYGVYYAIYDLIGENTWNIVWKCGEIVFEEAKNFLEELRDKDPFKVLSTLAKWLKDSGYVEDISVEKISNDTVKYIMLNPAIADGAQKLIKLGRVPAHISTSLMFAALKSLGYTAKMVGGPEFLSDGRVVEYWKLYKLN